MRGDVLIKVLSDNPSRFEPGSELLLGSGPESAAPVKVAASRVHQGAMIVRFYGVETRTDADRLRGGLIFVSASELGGLEEDAFWEHELIGLEVFDRFGLRLGQLQKVLSRAEQDLWMIATDSGPILLPAAKELVLSVDLESGRIIVEPPEGLFEEV
jgi:16S rRNA processing protein RimM